MDVNLYELLGCSQDSSTEQIIAEFRALAIQIHPDKCDSNVDKETAEKKFSDLHFAKEILCDPVKRIYYNNYLALKPSISVKQWMEMQEKLAQTMHFAINTGKTQMIEPSEPVTASQPTPARWDRRETPVLQAFRRGEI